MIEIGKKAPDFSLTGDDGRVYSLASFKNRKIILYFYPKDMTKGCTQEACDFTEQLNNFEAQGFEVVGISKDSVPSHARFKSLHNLKFILLSDPELVVHKAYGAYGEKTSYGKKTLGTIRTTFIIDQQGNLEKIWRNVRVKGHVAQVSTAASKLGGVKGELFSSVVMARKPAYFR